MSADSFNTLSAIDPDLTALTDEERNKVIAVMKKAKVIIVTLSRMAMLKNGYINPNRHIHGHRTTGTGNSLQGATP